MFVKTVLVVLLICSFDTISCDCKQRYVTFCDCVSDIRYYKCANWTDVIIDGSKQTCSFSIIRSDSFEALEEIKTLFVVNFADEIEKNAFKTVGETVQFVKFYENNLTHVKNEMFSGFKDVSRLILTNNQVKFIEGFSFNGSNIEILDLSNNQLEAIPEDAFNGGRINTIFLQHNKVSYINDNAFNEQIKVLKLDHNHLSHLHGFVPNLPRLKQLTVGHNQLSHISGIKTLENIKKLDFSFNNINTISAAEFEDLKQLVYLDLSSNNLETISLNIFKKVDASKMTLLISYNQLTNLEIPRNPKPIMTLTYFGNPWNCQCLPKIEKSFMQYNFTTTKCNMQLSKAGSFPICVEQGPCENTPLENREDLRRFVQNVNVTKQNLACDLFREVKDKDIVSVTSS